MIEIYALKIPEIIEDDLVFQLSQMISTEKRKKVFQFMKREDTYRALLADILVRAVIFSNLGLRNEEIEFSYNSFGKPFLKNCSNFHFNASHSGKWVVCITHNSTVGIDIEEIRPTELDIARHYFSAREYQDLLEHHPDDQLHYFYDLWTLKESYLKAIGKGLSIPLNSFTVRKTSNGNIELFQEEGQSEYFLKQYLIDTQYKLSVCGITDRFPNEIYFCDILQLLRNMM